MVDNISPITGPDGQLPIQQPTGQGAPQGTSFKEILIDSIKKVNQMQLEADQAINRLATGQTDNVADVMTAVEKADLAFRLLMQIRNKLVDAYGQITQMRF